MTQFYIDIDRESDAHALPDAETFEVTSHDLTDIYSAFHQPDGIYSLGTGTEQIGWYWWACMPGCSPDGDPNGPFKTEAEAIKDAREGDQS